jgi:hypothetical protein
MRSAALRTALSERAFFRAKSCALVSRYVGRATSRLFWQDVWAAHNWGTFAMGKWLASFGVTFSVIDILWAHLNPHLFHPSQLLMAHYFLHCYDPEL